MLDQLAGAWSLQPGVTYLNHGSFGPPPRAVQQVRYAWQQQLDAQPMQFFFRDLQPQWLAVRCKLADFIGTEPENLVFVDNATYAMNLVARNFPLQAGQEVVLTDHEYGAVGRIWQRACEEAGAAPPVIARLPRPIESAQQVVESVFNACSSRTRLLVVSHITSPTAITLPVDEICREARRREIAVCVDGPHALLQVPLDMDGLGCDFYTASCHKWLSAPFGSGFLYVHPRWQGRMRPLVQSWGVLPPDEPTTWWSEFVWSGTRDPTATLAISAAIEFFQSAGLDAVRHRNHQLARSARQRLLEMAGTEPWTPDEASWYGFMASVPVAVDDAKGLQQALWQQFQIEVPVVDFAGQRSLRVSCHLYNTTSDIDHLIDALKSLRVL